MTITGLVAICTKNRPQEIVDCVTAIQRIAPDVPVMLVDASDTNATMQACESPLRERFPGLKLHYHSAIRPGIAHQRNQAIDLGRELNIDVIHFIDDDTEVCDGYFQAIEGRFAAEPKLMGIGGVILNMEPRTHVRLRRIFYLAGRPGQVLPSGRNLVGQYPDANADDRVDWIVGCSMSYRMTAFDERRFDPRLEGYSLGEDLDFSFRLSREHPIAVEPTATCVHHMASTERYPMRSHARDRTVLTRRWVGEQRQFGMSMPLFWWSVIGDGTLHAAHGLLARDPTSLDQVRGVLDGVRDILQSRSRPT